jgi:CO/xanthine dehydrogenase Mo-binding subunit
MTIYSNDMKSYGLRNGVARFLNMPREQVRVVYMDGPQVYGRTAADDAGFEAAWLARELGRPVRVQWMRDEETAWDTKGPAYTFNLRGALDADGRVIALDYAARALDYNHLGYNEPDTVLVAQLMGIRPARAATGRAATPSVKYAIPNLRMTGHVVSLPMIWETPLRTGNLRDPNGPQVTFAFESFIDELAAAAGADPVEFRLDMLERSDEDELFRRSRSLASGPTAVAKSAQRSSNRPAAFRTRYRLHLSQWNSRGNDR